MAISTTRNMLLPDTMLGFIAGDTFEQECTMQAGGAPVDLTAAQLDAEIRVAPGATLIKAFTITITDSSAGEFTIGLTDTETDAIAPGRYRWDLRVTDGDVTTWAAGHLNVEAAVTEL